MACAPSRAPRIFLLTPFLPTRPYRYVSISGPPCVLTNDVHEHERDPLVSAGEVACRRCVNGGIEAATVPDHVLENVAGKHLQGQVIDRLGETAPLTNQVSISLMHGTGVIRRILPNSQG